MHPVAIDDRVKFEVGYVEQRNRLTNAFRIILAIPHLVFSALWGYAVEFAAVAQWFVIVFTGKRNRGIWEFQNGWLGYSGRVNAYVFQLYDPYPAFGDSAGDTPTRYSFSGQEPANRLTNALRLIWAIPALLFSMILTIGAFFVLFASWWVILFTGKQPIGMFGFMQKVLRYSLQTNSYLFLMTDTYPKYDDQPGPTPFGPGPSGPGYAPSRYAQQPGAGTPLPPPPPQRSQQPPWNSPG
ncbi:MAG: DUF4389 domain-containing protein [Actinomycetota bacterium]|nr:DUF4389 domain-containing protein [Actinomycetota bacterium]